jgi:hypothetical protein
MAEPKTSTPKGFPPIPYGSGYATMQSKLGFLKKNSAMDVGHAGVSANSQLTLRVDHLMKPVSVAESTAIGAACHSL